MRREERSKLKKTQTELLEMKNTVSELKHTSDGINSKSETAVEKN